MNDESNELESLRIYELKEKALAKYVEETGLKNASINQSVLASVGKEEIIIVYDNDSKILAHYQHLGKNQFFRMDKK